MLRLALARLPATVRPTEADAAADLRISLSPQAGAPILDSLVGDVELWLAEHARRFVFVHAAAVAVRGRAIVLPGRTRTGKTTLAAALVRAGADYYSDEYAVLDTHGVLRAYPRPLALRSSDGSAGGLLTVDDLGGTVGSHPVPVGLVASLAYRAESSYQPKTLTSAQGVLGLLDNAVAAQSRPRAVLTALTAVMTSAAAVRSARGEADETAIALLHEVDW